MLNNSPLQRGLHVCLEEYWEGALKRTNGAGTL